MFESIANTSSRTIIAVDGISGKAISDKLAIPNDFNYYFFFICSRLADQTPKLESVQFYFVPQF